MNNSETKTLKSLKGLEESRIKILMNTVCVYVCVCVCVRERERERVKNQDHYEYSVCVCVCERERERERERVATFFFARMQGIKTLVGDL